MPSTIVARNGLRSKTKPVRSGRWGSLMRRKRMPGTAQQKKNSPGRIQPKNSSRDTKKTESIAILQGIVAATTPSEPIASLAERGGTLASFFLSVSVPTATPGPTKQKRDRAQRNLWLAQFRFQSFKKCFYGKCATIFVPSDFKRCGPRRMFCSLQCFEAHWRERLSGNLYGAE